MSPLRRYRNWRNTRYLPGRCRHAGCRGKARRVVRVVP